MRLGKKWQGSGDNSPPCLMLDHASIFDLIIHTMAGCKTFIYVHLIWRPGRARSSARLSDRLLTDRPWVRIPPGPPLSIASHPKILVNNGVFCTFRLATRKGIAFFSLIFLLFLCRLKCCTELFARRPRLDPCVVSWSHGVFFSSTGLILQIVVSGPNL
jgi:hypothetical protein